MNNSRGGLRNEGRAMCSCVPCRCETYDRQRRLSIENNAKSKLSSSFKPYFLVLLLCCAAPVDDLFVVAA
jgi:hypothetical protein